MLLLLLCILILLFLYCFTENFSDQIINISIVNYEYKPKHIKIKIGTRVTWTNFDIIGHTITSKDDNYLDSQLLDETETYSRVFNTKGTYNYYCIPHPFMKGVVEVY